jgi:hypothetical protein
LKRGLSLTVLSGAIAMTAACSTASPGEVSGNDGGGPGGGNEGGTPGCVAVHAPVSFEAFKVADAAPTGGHPSVKLGPDGSPIVVFAVGELGEERIVAAHVPGAGAGAAAPTPLVPLSQLGPALTRPRVAATRDGGIAIAYVSGADATYHGSYITWTGRSDDQPRDVIPIPDTTDLAAPAIISMPPGSGAAGAAVDQPMMAFVYTDFSLRLLSAAADGSWRRETVEIGVLPFESTHIDMGLDAGGQPVLVATRPRETAYTGEGEYLPSSHGVTVWRRAAGGWTKDRLLTDYESVESRIRLSPAGEVTIFYEGSAGIARAVLRGDVWRTQDPIADVEGRSPQGYEADVAFGPQGEIHVALQTTEGLAHAVFDGCRWSQTIIDVIANEPSIVLDVDGNPHVAYEKVTGLIEATGAEKSEVWYARPRP